jgi:hypothetical protein
MVVPHGWVVRNWCNPSGQQWTHALTLLHMRDGRRVLLMVVLGTFRRPSLCRPVHRPCMRNAWLDFTTIVLTTYGSPIFKAVPKKQCKALYRALTKSLKSPESAVGEGSGRSNVEGSVAVPQ